MVLFSEDTCSISGDGMMVRELSKDSINVLNLKLSELSFDIIDASVKIINDFKDTKKSTVAFNQEHWALCEKAMKKMEKWNYLAYCLGYETKWQEKFDGFCRFCTMKIARKEFVNHLKGHRNEFPNIFLEEEKINEEIKKKYATKKSKKLASSKRKDVVEEGPINEVPCKKIKMGEDQTVAAATITPDRRKVETVR